MKLPNREELAPLGWLAAVLAVLVIAGLIWASTSFTGLLSLAFALFAYLILPGYVIMLNFNLPALERIIIGMAVSAAVVPAFLYTLNIIGLPLSRTIVLLTITVVVVLAIVYRKETKHHLLL